MDSVWMGFGVGGCCVGWFYLQKIDRRIKIDFDIPYSLSRRSWIYN